MDIISFSEAATANGRIEKINANPDSTSGIITVPKVIATGETVTIPAGRVAILPNVQVDGVLNIEGEVFIPSGATTEDLEDQLALKAPLASPAFTGTPTAPTPNAGDNSTKLATTAYVDGKMVLGAAVTASGTAIDFTNIPSWVKRVTVMFNGVSISGTSNVQLQIGTSGGMQTSGYTGGGSTSTTQTTLTTGFYIGIQSPTFIASGSFIINLLDSSNGTWAGNGIACISNAGQLNLGSGSKTLSGTLDRLRIATANGTDSFDDGTINIIYEG